MDKIQTDLEYQKCLKALEELQFSKENEKDILLSVLYQNLLSYKFQVENYLKQRDSLDSVKETLQEKIDFILSNFFSNKKMFKEFEFIKTTNMELSLEQWNNLLDLLPEFLTVATFFKFHGKVKILFVKNYIVIDGLIRFDPYIESQKTIINEITKKLLKSNFLLTFNSSESERTGLSHLRLKLDCSFDPEIVYRVDMKENLGVVNLLGFPNCVANYLSNPIELSQVNQHLIIEISEEFAVKSSIGSVDIIDRVSEKSLIHFDFLFKPVTLVLPNKGVIAKKSPLIAIGNEDFRNYGMIESERKQDVFFRFHCIDLFRLF